jgi:hypothetical protein
VRIVNRQDMLRRLQGEEGKAWVWTLVAIVVLLLGIGAASGGSTKTSKQTATNTSAAPQPHPSAPSPAKPAARTTTATEPAAPASPQITPADATAERMYVWYQRYGSIFNTVAEDSHEVASASSSVGNSGEFGEVISACQKLGADMRTAQSDPAIPDPQIAADWSTVLADLSSGAQDCVSGAEGDNVSLIEQATREFGQGDEALNKANEDLHSLVQSISG